MQSVRTSEPGSIGKKLCGPFFSLRSQCGRSGCRADFVFGCRGFPRHPRIEKLKAAEFGLLGATWWPLASCERLKVATYLTVWVSASIAKFHSHIALIF